MKSTLNNYFITLEDFVQSNKLLKNLKNVINLEYLKIGLMQELLKETKFLKFIML